MKTLVPSARRGVTLIETVVSFSLLVTVLGITTPLMVRHTRLLADGRAYRCAVDEVSNRLEVLGTISEEDLTEAIDKMADEELGGPLAGSRLRGTVDPADVGQRITLTLEWPSEHRQRPAVALVGWAIPPVARTEGEP